MFGVDTVMHNEKVEQGAIVALVEEMRQERLLQRR